MHRTNIYLTNEEQRLLAERARQEGTTMAQVVRDIIDHDLGIAETKMTLEEALRASAGIWSDRTEEDFQEMRRYRSHERFEPAES